MRFSLLPPASPLSHPPPHNPPQDAVCEFMSDIVRPAPLAPRLRRFPRPSAPPASPAPAPLRSPRQAKCAAERAAVRAEKGGAKLDDLLEVIRRARAADCPPRTARHLQPPTPLLLGPRSASPLRLPGGGPAASRPRAPTFP